MLGSPKKYFEFDFFVYNQDLFIILKKIDQEIKRGKFRKLKNMINEKSRNNKI